MRNEKEIVEYSNEVAFKKVATPLKKVVLLSLLAGAYIGLGALLSVVVGSGFPEISASNPSLARLLSGITFPMGLVLITLCGGELFTGCWASFASNLWSGRERVSVFIKYSAIVWVMNFAGALFVAYFMAYLTEVSHYQSTYDGFMTIAKNKTSLPFHVTMLKAVAANWLVCLAIWLSYSAKSMLGKIIGIWIPITAFVTIGFEHSIANMFLLPVAMFEGYDLSVCDLFVKNLIPVTLGNMIGGFIFVGSSYYYLYNRESAKK